MPRRGGNRSGVGRARAASALLAAAALALCAGACGGSDNGDVTLTIGARGTPEEEVLGQVYAQALRAAGYEVREDSGIETQYPDAPLKKLEHGRISGYPEHLNAALEKLFAIDDEDLPSDSREAYGALQAKLREKGLVAFPPAPFSLEQAVVVLRKTAQKRNLRTVSDLKGEAEEMVILGPVGCFLSSDCIGGLEGDYRVYFEAGGYASTDFLIRRRYAFLKSGVYDALFVSSTEGRLAAERGKFVALEDDKNAFSAGNAVFVTSSEVVDDAGSDFEKTVVAAQRGLTLPVVQQLDAEVELEGKDPARVAAAYLKQEGHLAG